MRTLHRSPRTWVCFGMAALLCASAFKLRGAAAPQEMAAPTAQQIEFFEASIRPVIFGVCAECHVDDDKGGLSLASRAAMMKGGDNGPAIIPGDAAKSRLIRMIRHEDGLKPMPKGEDKLSPAVIAAFEQWIAQGAPWPASVSRAAAPAAAKVLEITPEQRAWWAFRPLVKPAPPAVTKADWPKSDIDRFILARLEREGLAPVEAADRRT